MNNYVLTLVLALCLGVHAQSGNYAVDSVWFSTSVTPPPGGTLFVSVNRFTDSGFHQYSGGFWLYNRDSVLNSWENGQKTRYGYPLWVPNIDTNGQHGQTYKINVVRLRTKNSAGAILTDTAFFINVMGSGKSPHHSIPIVYLSMDSYDFGGDYGFYMPGRGYDYNWPLDTNRRIHEWNYELDGGILHSAIARERYEKKALVTIMDGSTNVLTQHCGIRISANSGVYLADKAMNLVARDQYGPDRLRTPWFGKTKNLKLRVKADWTYSVNEFISSAMKGMNIGEVAYKPVSVYVNGSSWSFAYMQDKVNEYSMSKVFGMNKDSVDFFTYSSLFKVANYQIPQIAAIIDTNALCMVPLGIDSSVIVANLEVGRKKPVQDFCQYVIDSIAQPVGDSTSRAQSVRKRVDAQKWAQYLAYVDYFHMTDILGNNLASMFVNGKLTPIARDFDGAMVRGSAETSWNETRTYLGPTSSIPGILIQEFLDNPILTRQFLLTYEDLLNSKFLPSRLMPMIDTLQAQTMPEYPLMMREWKNEFLPIDTDGMRARFNQWRAYVADRPDFIWHELSDTFIDGRFALTDRNLVQINLNNVPQGTARVALNSLTLDSSWSGLYYPDPDITVAALVSNPALYYWKEFPDSALSMTLSPDSAITLTLVRRQTVLGVKLVSLAAHAIENRFIKLDFETAGEINADRFMIERSTDSQFMTIGTVAARGITTAVQHYVFNDTKVSSGIQYYYRLKIIDIDGRFEYSQIVAASIAGDVTISIYPNPSQGIVYIEGLSEGEHVVITNSSGAVIREQELQKRSLDLGDLPKGVYFISVAGLPGGLRNVKVILK